MLSRQGETKGRTRGLAAQKANIMAAKAVCNILRTSLGPKGTRALVTGLCDHPVGCLTLVRAPD